jgi:hypothetical protein
MAMNSLAQTSTPVETKKKSRDEVDLEEARVCLERIETEIDELAFLISGISSDVAEYLDSTVADALSAVERGRDAIDDAELEAEQEAAEEADDDTSAAVASI